MGIWGWSHIDCGRILENDILIPMLWNSYWWCYPHPPLSNTQNKERNITSLLSLFLDKSLLKLLFWSINFSKAFFRQLLDSTTWYIYVYQISHSSINPIWSSPVNFLTHCSCFLLYIYIYILHPFLAVHISVPTHFQKL